MSSHITDPYWTKKMELIRKVMIPYQWEVLNDRVEDAPPSYCIHNFRVAAKLHLEKNRQGQNFQYPHDSVNGFCVWPEDPAHPDDKFYGFLFQDSDIAKWIEAAAYTLSWHPDAALEETIDDAIDIVCAAQMNDGYLDTFYIINDISKRFTNLKDNHELYCFGHMTEAAVAYYQVTGKKKLLKAVCRYADYIASHLGKDDGKLPGYPGHEIAEMALVRLYGVTGEKKYLDLGQYFIDERGNRPYYYDRETGNTGDALRYQYNQAHLPVREQFEAVGHAVRAVYLYSGMADYAKLLQDPALLHACKELWNSIVNTKMYITGGIGATHIGESFSFAYDLPNDTAYSETCASIGMMFFAKRMLEIEKNSKYADIMERELFNVVLSGMDLSGTRFFYVNPLEVYPKACYEDERKEHVKAQRQRWFGCACCPPNVARLIGSLDTYLASDTEAQNDPFYLHLLVGAEYSLKTPQGDLHLLVDSSLPWSGKLSLLFSSSVPTEKTIAIRIPGWSDGYTVMLNGQPANLDCFVKDGYLHIHNLWQNDTLTLDFSMMIQVLEADTRVRENIGKAAIMRGPLIYCLEEADNGPDLHLLQMNPDNDYQEVETEINGEKVIAIKAKGWKEVKRESSELYRPCKGLKRESVELTWIPYYIWNNRSEGEMQVWTRRTYS